MSQRGIVIHGMINACLIVGYMYFSKNKQGIGIMVTIVIMLAAHALTRHLTLKKTDTEARYATWNP